MATHAPLLKNMLKYIGNDMVERSRSTARHNINTKSAKYTDIFKRIFIFYYPFLKC